MKSQPKRQLTAGSLFKSESYSPNKETFKEQQRELDELQSKKQDKSKGINKKFFPLDYQKQKESLNQLLTTKQKVIKQEIYKGYDFIEFDDPNQNENPLINVQRGSISPFKAIEIYAK